MAEKLVHPVVVHPAVMRANLEQYASMIFVRSQDNLAFDSENASGRRLSAWEVADIFQDQFEVVIQEIEDYGAFPLPVSYKEPANSLRSQREHLGFEYEDVVRRLDDPSIGVEEIKRAEDSNQASPIRLLDRIGQRLSLEERFLSLVAWSPSGCSLNDAAYVTKVRTFQVSSKNSNQVGGSLPGVLTEAGVLNCNGDWSFLCDAAWVAHRQSLLQRWLYGESSGEKIRKLFEFDDDFKNPIERGYALAALTREKLGISLNDYVSMTAVLVDKLAVPTMNLQLPGHIAGVVIEHHGERAIILNSNPTVDLPSVSTGGPTACDQGYASIWVNWLRRYTMAHELCHLVWDSEKNLQSIRFDTSSWLDSVYDPNNLGEFSSQGHQDPEEEELRANAFAIEFLAPREAVRNFWREIKGQGISIEERMEEVINHFGICWSAARHHIRNAFRGTPEEAVVHSELLGLPSRPDCEKLEIEIHSAWEQLKPWSAEGELASVPIVRQGTFAKLVAECWKRGMLSDDSAGCYLGLKSLSDPSRLEKLLESS